MNICVTLNPCLDKTLITGPWQPGEHQVRGRAVEMVVGGKGVNVARGLQHLERPSLPALPLGGEVGRLCARLLTEQDHFPLQEVCWTRASTREILTVRTDGTADQTAFFDPNPEIEIAERDRLAAQLKQLFTQEATWCAMSGSSPCKTTDSLFAEMVELARAAGVRTLVDSYGDSLLQALEAAPDIVKMNCRECELALSSKLDSVASIRDAFEWIRGFGVPAAMITFGAAGAVASWSDQLVAWKPPAIQVVNPIGAGDAMTAGLIDARLEHREMEASFRWAMACGVSSVERWVACDFDRTGAAAMEPRVSRCELAELLAES
jgi:tagatose 6-phosphate kinase